MRRGYIQTLRREQQLVDNWNAKHPVGTPVRYWKGARDGGGLESKTRSEASILSGHTAVLWVEGYGSCIALTHVEALAAGPVPVEA